MFTLKPPGFIEMSRCYIYYLMSVDLHSFSLKAKFRPNVIKVFKRHKYVDRTAANCN